MAEPRIKAGLWVSAALRLSFNEGRGGAVLRRGDEDAGGILVVLRGRSGELSVLSAVAGDGGERAWMRGTGPDPVDQAVADAYVERQVGRDPDLWVVEFDAPDVVPPFWGTDRLSPRPAENSTMPAI